MNYLVFDTETINKIDNSIVINFAYIIVVKKEIVIQKNYLVNDFITDNKKIKYYNDIKIKSISNENFINIISEFNNYILEYNIKYGYGYNHTYDTRAIKNTFKVLNSNLNMTLEFKDIKKLVEKYIVNKKSYIQFCIKNKFFTDNNYIKTDLETVYKYITKNIFYKQEHKALQDVIIENELLKYLFKDKIFKNENQFN